jgi:hypothetical protein
MRHFAILQAAVFCFFIGQEAQDLLVLRMQNACTPI